MAIEQITSVLSLDATTGTIQFTRRSTPVEQRAIMATGQVWHGKLAEQRLTRLKTDIVPIYASTGMFVTPTADSKSISMDSVNNRSAETPMALAVRVKGEATSEQITLITRTSALEYQAFTFSAGEEHADWTLTGQATYSQEDLPNHVAAPVVKAASKLDIFV